MPNTVSTLKFNAKTVEINGTINVDGLKTGGGSKQCDLLDCGTAAVTLQEKSFLDVETTGSGDLGKGNQWTVMAYGSITSTAPSKSWGFPIIGPPGKAVSTGKTSVEVSN